ncbi:hypothetical protein [Bergeriella denitrificans]|nr:hypothetical protein [Bergeriella denitrificans]
MARAGSEAAGKEAAANPDLLSEEQKAAVRDLSKRRVGNSLPTASRDNYG